MIYFKRNTPTATLPRKGTARAAGFDFSADLGLGEEVTIYPGNRIKVSTGISVAIPQNTYMRMSARGGMAFKNGIDVLGSGIDEDYRGEISVILINHGTAPYVIRHGDRIAQGIIEMLYDTNAVRIVDDLPYSERGESGLGSTGA